eukprot:scaffold37418_cov30-Tisochrysis_lutea.AAC.1
MAILSPRLSAKQRAWHAGSERSPQLSKQPIPENGPALSASDSTMESTAASTHSRSEPAVDSKHEHLVATLQKRPLVRMPAPAKRAMLNSSEQIRHDSQTKSRSIRGADHVVDRGGRRLVECISCNGVLVGELATWGVVELGHALSHQANSIVEELGVQNRVVGGDLREVRHGRARRVPIGDIHKWPIEPSRATIASCLDAGCFGKVAAIGQEQPGVLLNIEKAARSDVAVAEEQTARGAKGKVVPPDMRVLKSRAATCGVHVERAGVGVALALVVRTAVGPGKDVIPHWPRVYFGELWRVQSALFNVGVCLSSRRVSRAVMAGVTSKHTKCGVPVRNRYHSVKGRMAMC